MIDLPKNLRAISKWGVPLIDGKTRPELLNIAADEIDRLRAMPTVLPVQVSHALSELPPGHWETWTSNSYRRISASPDGLRNGPDGGVLRGTIQSDGHPDLSWTEEQCKAICAIVNWLRELDAQS